MSAARPEPETPSEPGEELSGQALLGCLHAVTRLYGKPVSRDALTAGLPLPGGRFGPQEFVRAAAANGYSAQVVRRRLRRISPLLLPVVLVQKDGGACVLSRIISRDEVEVVFPESGFGGRVVSFDEVRAQYSGYAIFVQPELEPTAARGTPVIERKRAWFWGSLAAYTPYYLEAIVAGVVVNVLTIASALFIMNVYDRVVPNNAFETLIVLAAGTVTAVGFEFCARTLRAYFLESAGRRADLVLASQIFAQAMGIRLEARPASAGAFAAQLREFESVREFITAVTLTTLMDIPFVAFFIGIVGLIGGPISTVPLAAVPLIFLVGLLAQIPLAHAMRQNLEEIARRHGLLVEALHGIETVKAMRAEGQMQARYEDYTALAGRSSYRARMISSTVVHFTATVLQLVVIGMVFWGVYLIAEGQLTVGGLVACVILIGRGMAPLQQVASLMMRYQQARASYFNLQSLMRQPLEREIGQQFTHRPDVAGSVSMKAVSFAYPASQVTTLNEVSFSIAAGEKVAILGRVGSGKTTLLKLVAGFLRPVAGTVCVDEVDIAQFDPADLRRQLGYVGQEPGLVRGTLRDNIALGRPDVDDARVLEAARMAGLEGFIAQHPQGLQREVGEGGSGLSGGQKQAVAIARALLIEPAVLLFDEPTSAMDHSSENAFIGELKRYAANRTLLLVTHKPTMLALVERIIVLDGGRVVMDGARDEVLRTLTRQGSRDS